VTLLCADAPFVVAECVTLFVVRAHDGAQRREIERDAVLCERCQ
jgi:hypothetical protein